MSGNYIHIFKSKEHLPENPVHEFNRIVAPVSKGIVAPFLKRHAGEAYLIDEYTKEDAENCPRFDEIHIGEPYFRMVGLKGCNWAIKEHGEASNSSWAVACLLPDEGELLEQKIAELFEEIGISASQPLISWVYKKFIPEVEGASERIGLRVHKHY